MRAARLSAVAALAAMFPFFPMFGGGPPRIVAKRMRPMTWSKPHQGKQEMARRVRQMERNARGAS